MDTHDSNIVHLKKDKLEAKYEDIIAISLME